MLPNHSMHPNHSVHPNHTVQPIFVSGSPPRQGPLAVIAAALGGALAASGVLVLLLLHHVADLQGSQQEVMTEASASLRRAEAALGAALARVPAAAGPRALPSASPACAPLGAPAPAPVAVPVISHAALACVDDLCTIHPEGLDLLLRPESLARSARVIPVIVDGEARGMKLYGIRSGSVPRLLGFKNGDLVRAVNGQPLTVESAPGLYEALRERRLGRLEVEVERKGVVLTRTFAIG